MRDLKARCEATGLIPASIHGSNFGGEDRNALAKDAAHKIRLIEAARELGVTRVGATGSTHGSQGSLDAIITPVAAQRWLVEGISTTGFKG